MKSDKYQPDTTDSSALFMLRPEERCRVCNTHHKLVAVIYTNESTEVAAGFEICGSCIGKLFNIKFDFLDKAKD